MLTVKKRLAMKVKGKSHVESLEWDVLKKNDFTLKHSCACVMCRVIGHTKNTR